MGNHVGQKFVSEVSRFQFWASAYPHQDGEKWESNYEHCDALANAFLEFVDKVPFMCWTAAEQAAVLYTIARDNDEYLICEIGKRHRELLLNLAELSLRIGETNAKWQIARELGRPATNASRQESLLLVFATDDDECVRNRSLLSLARIGSSATEKLALEVWSRQDESQQWARMNALLALHEIGSAQLKPLLIEAEQENWPYLSAFPVMARRGDV